MKWYVGYAVFLGFSCVVLFDTAYGGKKYVSNLSAVCLKCLCYASTQCNATVGCQKGYCGLFFITKEYWAEAGRPTLPDDDPDRTNAFSDCSKDYTCASTAVEGYMAKNGFDCNNDGVTDCDDYARIHFHGKDKCLNSISNLNFGRRYDTCRPVTDRGGQLAL
ncbi:uncharacterized protein LOC135845853 [Planococcus citri]|uniref:uncharacterized protein LOC135845853 n=1 Tax=Planococcus citri TaxID=170843 RepID=UPI0031F8C5D1